jgi:glycerol-3-phosphate acyltransferase PlsX
MSRPRSLRRRVDVVVADGFVGNITLKTAESLATGMFRLLKRELTSTPVRRLGAWLAQCFPGNP